MNIFPDVTSWMKFVEEAVKRKPVPSCLNDIQSKYRALLQQRVFQSQQTAIECFTDSYKTYATLMTRSPIIKEAFDTKCKKNFFNAYNRTSTKHRKEPSVRLRKGHKKRIYQFVIF